MLQALKVVKGDLSDKQVKFRAALNAIGAKGFNSVRGPIKLDINRQAIGNNYLIQLTSLSPETYKTLRTIPNVDQSFSGFFTTKTPTPGRELLRRASRRSRRRGSATTRAVRRRSRPLAVTAAAAPIAEPILRLRGVGRRFGGVQAVRDVDLDVAHGERRAILGPERRREDDAVQSSSPVTSRPRPGRSR